MNLKELVDPTPRTSAPPPAMTYTPSPAMPYGITRTLLAVQIGAAVLGVLIFLLPFLRGLEQGEGDTLMIGIAGMAGSLTWMTIALVGRVVVDIAIHTRKAAN